jgi:23S rRNA pseudouridine955/2504/2580 synthase
MRKFNLEDIIIFENEAVLAVNKPSGLSTLEDRVDTHNVLSMVKELYPQIKNCHRLDKYTSGVLLFAKNPETYRAISMQFQNREVKKVYHALVHGKTEFEMLEVNVPLSIKSAGNVVFDYKVGKESTTYFNTLKNFRVCSLVECVPVTGRKHQIRVHLKYAKHLIISDEAYGGEPIFLSQIKKNYKKSEGDERPLINRMALHAYSLDFKLPGQENISVTAPYPKDFRLMLSQLEKYG